MEENIVLAKREIAILTENNLYRKIISQNGDSSKDIERKNRIKEEMIDVFAQECKERYPELSLEQIKEHIVFVLNRTIENIKKINQGSER